MRNILWNDDLKDWDGSSYYTYAYNENGVLITFVSYGGGHGESRLDSLYN
ncbi:MAG: hypothetical protein ACK5MK_06535 [Dysgonomonas sp.]